MILAYLEIGIDEICGELNNQQLIKDAVTKANTGERVQFQALGSTAKGTAR